jgi:hypothetical protein
MRNEKGIALVLVLVLSLIALAIVSALLFMITQGTQLSGFHKFYRTSEEAAMGGVEASLAFIRAGGASVPGDVFHELQNARLGIDAGTSSAACLGDKLNHSTADWHCGADDKTFDPTNNPDMTFELGTDPTFMVFAKLVDTTKGNTDTSGLVTEGELGGTNTVNANSAMVSPPQIPYLYSIEVQAQDSGNARERSNLSVLYAR